MSSLSTLSPLLIRAYTHTHYRVLAARPFTLHIARHSAALQSLHSAYGVDCSSFVTACNPYSQSWSPACNSARHQGLLASLAKHGYPYIAGYGRHPAGNWPAERSVLVLGLSLNQAELLGSALHQNAVVWAGGDAVPQLVLLR